MVSLQTIPKVALAPILVMWLGYGILPKVMVAFLFALADRAKADGDRRTNVE